MTKSDLSTALRERLPDRLLPWCRGCKVHHVHDQVLRTAALFGGFVFGEDEDDIRPPARTAGGGARAATLVRTDRWLGRDTEPGAPAWPRPRAARAATRRGTLLRRYLACYGPADAAMFASWLGVSTADGARRFAEADDAGELAPVAITGGRSTAWLHIDDVERFRSTKPTDARGVRLIPPSDPYLQQRDREVVAAEPAWQKQIWTPLGSPGAVVIDGTVAATWRAQKKGDALALTVKPFGTLRPRDVRAIEADAEYVARARGTRLTGVTIAG